MTAHRQHHTLTEGCGLFDRTFLHQILDMTGEDRRRFLNAQVTCDVAQLEPGGWTYGFFVSQKGKIQADVTILDLEDRFRLILPAGRRKAIREHLETYVLVDRVEMEAHEGTKLLTLLGPKAVAPLRALGEDAPEDGSFRHLADVAGAEAYVVRQALYGVDAVTLEVADGDAQALSAELVRGKAAPVDFEAVETVRVEQGAPRFGAEFGPDNFPQETGLDDAVSYEKGCYLGQEVVARIHYRGGVNRHLRGLRFEEGDLPAAGTEVIYESRGVGTLGTVVRSPALDAGAGLAILHQRAEPGARVTVGKTGAVVTALPWNDA